MKSKKSLYGWRKKSFVLYDRLAFLIDGVIATGNGAFRPGVRIEDWDSDDNDEVRISFVRII